MSLLGLNSKGTKKNVIHVVQQELDEEIYLFSSHSIEMSVVLKKLLDNIFDSLPQIQIPTNKCLLNL